MSLVIYMLSRARDGVLWLMRAMHWTLDPLSFAAGKGERESKGTLVMLLHVVQQEGDESVYRGLTRVLTSLCAPLDSCAVTRSTIFVQCSAAAAAVV